MSFHSKPWPFIGSKTQRAELFKTELLGAALGYCEKGYPVFPASLKDGQKKPLVKWGKGAIDQAGAERLAARARKDDPDKRWLHDPMRWRRATTDREIVLRWWTRWPLAMIGMPTGRVSGVIVLDVDRKSGVDGLKNLRAAGFDPFKMTKVVSRTPSGGLHFFFGYSDNASGILKNSAGLLAAGVDVRTDGGYIVLPPSLPDLDRDEYMVEEGCFGL